MFPVRHSCLNWTKGIHASSVRMPAQHNAHLDTTIAFLAILFWCKQWKGEGDFTVVRIDVLFLEEDNILRIAKKKFKSNRFMVKGIVILASDTKIKIFFFFFWCKWWNYIKHFKYINLSEANNQNWTDPILRYKHG